VQVLGVGRLYRIRFSSNVKVKVAAISNEAEVFGESAVFKIRGNFTNLRVEDQTNTPVNVLQAGDPYYVRWTTTGSGLTNVVLRILNR